MLTPESMRACRYNAHVVPVGMELCHICSLQTLPTTCQLRNGFTHPICLQLH